MVKKHRYGIEVTPASRARLFHAVIVGALGTFALFGFYMTGEYLVDMHKENRALLAERGRLMDGIHFQDAKIKELETQVEGLFDENYELQKRLDRYGEINAPILYEPDDESAAQPLYQEDD